VEIDAGGDEALLGGEAGVGSEEDRPAAVGQGQHQGPIVRDAPRVAPLGSEDAASDVPAECEALAMSLRAMAVGEYGYLRSVEIVEILGPNDMIVEEAKLIDADALDKAEDADRDRLEREGYDRNAIDAYIGVTYAQRRALEERQDDRDFDEPFHLSGYATEGLKKKQRWFGPDDKGIHIALVGYEAYGESRRRQGHRMVAIDPAVVGLGVDEATFVAFLAQRGMTPPRFVELLHDELTAARERDDADRAVFAKLLPVDPEKSEED